MGRIFGRRGRRIVLIACASRKIGRKAKAKELYDSPLFKLSLAYAVKLKADKTFILSAKHGLLDPEKKIRPYNQTLNTMPAAEVRRWAARVLGDLGKKTDLKRDRFIFLAGDQYRKYLIPHLAHYEVPMMGMPIGRQLQFLKRETGR